MFWVSNAISGLCRPNNYSVFHSLLTEPAALRIMPIHVPFLRDFNTQLLFMPPPATDRCGRGIMFSGCPSVSTSVRLSVRQCVRPISTIKQWTEFHQTLVDDVFEGTDELIRF